MYRGFVSSIHLARQRSSTRCRGRAAVAPRLSAGEVRALRRKARRSNGLRGQVAILTRHSLEQGAYRPVPEPHPHPDPDVAPSRARFSAACVSAGSRRRACRKRRAASGTRPSSPRSPRGCSGWRGRPDRARPPVGGVEGRPPPHPSRAGPAPGCSAGPRRRGSAPPPRRAPPPLAQGAPPCQDRSQGEPDAHVAGGEREEGAKGDVREGTNVRAEERSRLPHHAQRSSARTSPLIPLILPDASQKLPIPRSA
jgi:hypothetical protein